MLILSTLIVVTAAVAVGGLLLLYRRFNRQQAARLPDGEVALRQARSVPARVFVEKTLMAGPRANGINHARADLSLSPARLVVATHHGRILELTPARAGSARVTGPRRLVVEGERLRKDGPMQIRVELILDDAQAWADACAATLGSEQALSVTG
ncbi:MAG: hypothetical protein H6739_22790 [Alphaproteobacteria bacterium]|nr:hypothetical protein [Alphaproteobacteria bacterium]